MKIEGRGHIHPISSLIREAAGIFRDMGFTVADGPLVESKLYHSDSSSGPSAKVKPIA